MEELNKTFKELLLVCLIAGFIGLMLAFISDTDARGLEIGGIGKPFMIVSPHNKAECFLKRLEINTHPKSGDQVATAYVFGDNCFIKKDKKTKRKLTKTLFIRGNKR